MPKKCVAAVVILITIHIAYPASADDSLARFGAGGIEFVKSEDIRLVEETLEISPKLVQARLCFINESSADIDTTVAFPLPPYPPNFVYGPSGVSNPSTVMRTFKLWVNGKPNPTGLHSKAVVDQMDITDELRSIGLTREQIFRDDELTTDQTAAVSVALGKKLGKGRSWDGMWQIAETRHWRQLFPAGKTVVLEHTYEPAAGAYYESAHRWPGEKEKEVCLDDATKRAIQNQIGHVEPETEPGRLVFVTAVEYILGTGRNWKGPIGRFTLRIRKEHPDDTASLCFPGKPVRINPMTLEFKQQDFNPPEKLLVHFYSLEGIQ